MSKEAKEGKNNSKSMNRIKITQTETKAFIFYSLHYLCRLRRSNSHNYIRCREILHAGSASFDPTQLEPARTSFLYDKDGQLVTPLMGAKPDYRL